MGAFSGEGFFSFGFGVPKFRRSPIFFQISTRIRESLAFPISSPLQALTLAAIWCAAPRESYGLAAMDFEYVPASPGSSRWAGESAARRRQRRLSSPSLRTYLTPAFDAVAGGEGGVSGYSSSSSSGGLELGFDASLLRYRRSCFAASADLDSRVLYSPQSMPPPPPQMRASYLVADDGVWAPGAGHYGSKHEVLVLLSRSSFIDNLGSD